MTGRPLLVLALPDESQGKLETLGCEVLYCGVGKVNASYHLTRRLCRTPGDFSWVLNLGSAGSPTYPTGSLAEADRFVQRDMDATGLGFAHGETPFDDGPHMICMNPHFPSLPHGICGSGDSFLQAPSPIPCDIIDMEAYALAKICAYQSIPFASVKYITDGADGTASTDWQENLRHAADAFMGLLSPLLHKAV